MQGNSQDGGFTIVEVMIVLAVTAILFVSAMLMIAGRQERTQFEQAMRDMDSQIQDVINDVSTGYFPNDGSIRCVPSGAGISISANPRPAGTNKDCMFVGKALQFRPDSQAERYIAHSVLGKREDSGRLVTQLQNAAITTNPAVQNEEEYVVGGGLQVLSVRAMNGNTNLGAVAFYSSLGQLSGNGDLMSGAQVVELYAIPGTLNRTAGFFAANYVRTSLDDASRVTNARNLSKGGVKICISNGGSRRGSIVIGGAERSLTTTVNMEDTCS